MKSQWIAAVVVLAVVVGRTADATDGEVRVQDRNRCRGHATVLATLEGHGSENRTMPDGSIKSRPMWIPTVAIDGSLAVSGDMGGVVKVWSVHSDTAELVASAKEHAGGIMGLWIQGTTVVSGSQDKTIKVWTLRRSGGADGNALTAEVARTLTGHTDGVNGVSVWKGTLASGSTDGTVRLWNFETGEAIATLKGHTAAVNNVRIRGDVVVSASDDKSVRVWSVSKQASTHTFADAHSNFAFGVALHRRTAITASFDRTLKVWNLATRKFQYYLDADIGFKLAVDVDGDALVAARGPTNDAKVYTFQDAATGWRCRALLKGGENTEGHTHSVMSAAISGDKVITAGKDGVVKIWHVPLVDPSPHSEL